MLKKLKTGRFFTKRIDDSVITPRLDAGVVTRLKMNLRSPSLSVSESGNEELCSELSPVLDERGRRSLRCCVDVFLASRTRQVTTKTMNNQRLATVSRPSMKIKNFSTPKCREIKCRKRYFYVFKKQSRLTHD